MWARGRRVPGRKTCAARQHSRRVAASAAICLRALAWSFMPQTVEVSLRIPSLRMKRAGKDVVETVANSDVRFWKRVEVEAAPKPGDVLEMVVGSDGAFTCEVVRKDWDENKNMFVVSCRYSKRSISADEYEKLMNAPDWQVRSLL